MQSKLGAVEDSAMVLDAKSIVSFDLATSLSSPVLSLCSLRVEQTEKIIPLITCETSFG